MDTLSRTAWKNAHTYLKASKVLIGVDESLVFPSVTLAAFSCELFLKSLLYHSSKKSGGHNIEDLLNIFLKTEAGKDLGMLAL